MIGTTADLAEIRAIAKEAYIYGYPLVDNIGRCCTLRFCNQITGRQL